MKKTTAWGAIFTVLIIIMSLRGFAPDTPRTNDKCDTQIKDYIKTVNELGCKEDSYKLKASEKHSSFITCRLKYYSPGNSISSLDNEFQIALDKCSNEHEESLDEFARLTNPKHFTGDKEIVCLTSDPRTCKTKDFWSSVDSGEVLYIPGGR